MLSELTFEKMLYKEVNSKEFILISFEKSQIKKTKLERYTQQLL